MRSMTQIKSLPYLVNIWLINTVYSWKLTFFCFLSIYRVLLVLEKRWLYFPFYLVLHSLAPGPPEEFPSAVHGFGVGCEKLAALNRDHDNSSLQEYGGASSGNTKRNSIIDVVSYYSFCCCCLHMMSLG